MKRERNDGSRFQYLWMCLGLFLRTEFQCLKRTMKLSVITHVRSVFIIKQRHSLSRNKRLCSPTENTKSGGRSEVREGAGESHMGNSAHCGDYWCNIHKIYLLCHIFFKTSIFSLLQLKVLKRQLSLWFMHHLPIKIKSITKIKLPLMIYCKVTQL